jgi:hypothetical protein
MSDTAQSENIINTIEKETNTQIFFDLSDNICWYGDIKVWGEYSTTINGGDGGKYYVYAQTMDGIIHELLCLDETFYNLYFETNVHDSDTTLLIHMVELVLLKTELQRFEKSLTECVFN